MNRVSVWFDPQKLADEMFKEFRSMDNAIKEVMEFKENAAGLKQNQPTAIARALKTLASMIATRNYYRMGSKEFNKEINVWLKKHENHPQTDTSYNDLISILDQYGMQWSNWSSSSKMRKLRAQLQGKTMKEWTEGLYNARASALLNSLG